MIPLGVVRVLTLLLGGLVPAFASYKALELEDGGAQRALLAYWAVFALLSAVELPADAALSWLPLYSEAKLALLLWLLTPRFAGAMLLYRGVLRGCLHRHQPAIERALQHAHLQHGLWALAALTRLSFGVLVTLARAAWLLAPPSTREASPSPETSPPGTRGPVPYSPEAEEADAVHTAARPYSARPATPLDTAQVTLLGAGLEESCAMLLRTALAAQAGNQLLASLQSQAAVLASHQQPALGAHKKRHSRRRTVVISSAAAAAESRHRDGSDATGPSESGGGRTGHAAVYSNPAADSRPDSDQ